MKRYGNKKSLHQEDIGTPYGRKPSMGRTPEQTFIANMEKWYKKGYRPKYREIPDGMGGFKRR